MEKSQNLYKWQNPRQTRNTRFKLDNTKPQQSASSHPEKSTSYNSSASGHSKSLYHKYNVLKSRELQPMKWVNPASSTCLTPHRKKNEAGNISLSGNSPTRWKRENKVLNKTQATAQPSSYQKLPIINTGTKWTKDVKRNAFKPLPKDNFKSSEISPRKSIQFVSSTKLIRTNKALIAPREAPRLKVNTKTKLIRLNNFARTNTLKLNVNKAKRTPHSFNFIRKGLPVRRKSFSTQKLAANIPGKSFRYISIQGKTYKSNGRTLKRQSLEPKTSPVVNNISPSSRKASLSKIKKLQPGQLTKIVRRRQKVSVIQKRDDHCLAFGMTGKCSRYQKRICPFIHDVEKVAICTRFLRGNCQVKNCPFNHKYCRSKMPNCVHFTDGFCQKDDCKYRHVKVASDAPFCLNFLRGVCVQNDECKKQHVLICHEFQKDGKCSYGKACPLSHRKLMPRVSRLTSSSSSKVFYVTRKWGTFGTRTNSRKAADVLDSRYFDPTSSKTLPSNELQSVRQRLLKQVGHMTARSVAIPYDDPEDPSSEDLIIQKPLPAVLEEFIPL